MCARVFGGSGGGATGGGGSGVGAGGGGVDYLAVAARAGACVWARGLLHKGVGLCHGIAGSGYALLSLHRATGDARWRARAEQAAAFGVAKLPELGGVPDRPLSLFEGTCGLAALCLDLQDPGAARWPAYEYC